jgi:hypothetical protein
MTVTRLHTFAAGDAGPWRIARVRAVIGESLALSSRLAILAGEAPAAGLRSLRGSASNERCVTRPE